MPARSENASLQFLQWQSFSRRESNNDLWLRSVADARSPTAGAIAIESDGNRLIQARRNEFAVSVPVHFGAAQKEALRRQLEPKDYY